MIYDKILKGLDETDFYRKMGKKVLMEYKPTFVKVQNIADYLYSVSENEFEGNNINTNFPNIAPPWKCFWMEYKTPTPDKINTKEDLSSIIGQESTSVGVLCLGNKNDKDVGGWSLAFHLYGIYENKVFYSGNILITCDNNGVPNLKQNKNNDLMVLGMPYNKDLKIHSGNISMVQVPLLSISFCHCKNVIIDTVKLSKGQLKKRAKTGKPTAYSYHILNIEPMKKVFKTNNIGSSIQKGLHICRGHFKDYRGSQGLFGKHKDIYWWESHVKGTNPDRVVEKEYKIKNKGE